MLSLPAEGGVRHRPSRFLSHGTSGFWVAAPADEGPTIEGLIRSRRPVGVSFTSADRRVMFAAPVELQGLKRVNLTERVPALMMGFPPGTTVVQRRTREAARVPAGADVRVRVWRIDERAQLTARPTPQEEVACDLRDISTGGLGLTFYGRGGDPPRVAPDGRLRVELSHPGGTLLAEGRVRHLSPATVGSNAARGGIEFASVRAQPDDDTPAAEQLARIVAELQRQAQRAPRAATLRRG